MIGIIGAMDTEVDNIKAQVKGKTVSEIAGVEFVCGFIEDVTVCVAKWSEKNEENLPAKEETRIEGTRFQTENVNKERQKGTCSPSCKGQKATFLLITDWVRFGEKQNLKGK